MPGPSSPPALEISALEQRYRPGLLRAPRRVLGGIDLALARGASLGLIGPNGSGKSTLLRLAAGLERPSAGRVRLFGLAPEERAARRRVGYLSDGFPFPPELSPRAVLRLSAALHGLERREVARRSELWLERVGLARDAGRALGHFSLGMKRRFALAEACLHAPELLLLDEPTVGLDAQGYVVLDELLAEARSRGAALVVATHVLGDLQDHCAESAVLFDGRIAARGPTGELVRGRAELVALYRELGARAADGRS